MKNENRVHTCALLLLCASAQLHGQVRAGDWWVTDGAVNAIVKNEGTGTIYVGGDFASFSPEEENITWLNRQTGAPDRAFANPNYVVFCVIEDGQGGWYVGGSFNEVGGQPRSHVARINADGSLHPWAPTVNGNVAALRKYGNTVFIGGAFSSVNGQARSNLAAVDAQTGDIQSPPIPTPNATVLAIEISGTTVFLGGWFDNVGLGQYRRCGAAFDVVTNQLMAWNPQASFGLTDFIGTIHLAGGSAYVAGSFTSIGGVARSGLAEVNTTTGAVLPWNPGPNGSGVNDIERIGNTVYIGGAFSLVGGQARSCLAAIDAGTGIPTAWAPSVGNGVVDELVIVGDSMFVGGTFWSLNSEQRFHLGVVHLATGANYPWKPVISGSRVNAIVVGGSSVMVGGSFQGAGGVARTRLAAFDVPTAALTSWAPEANGAVRTIALNGGDVLVAGDLTDINGVARGRIAAINALTGALTSWSPTANDRINDMEVNGGVVYVGGEFTTIGSATRNRLAAVSLTTGLATAWDPNVAGAVITLCHDAANVYAGGGITSVGGTPSANFAAINATSGALLPWATQANGRVTGTLLSGNTLYIGGLFGSLFGQPRSRMAAIDVANGQLLPWAPAPASGTPPSDVRLDWVMDQGAVYVTGRFNTVGGASRTDVASVSSTTAQATVWDIEDDPYQVYRLNVVEVMQGRTFLGGTTGFFVYTGQGSSIAARIVLGGAFDPLPEMMRDDLRAAGLLPVAEPYAALGETHYAMGGTEQLLPGATTSTGADALVDWVFLEFRDPTDPAVVLATRSAMVQRDGDVVDMDGVSPVSIGVGPGNYNVSIRHRNHLGVMTATPIALSSTTTTIDFTNPATATYGSNAQNNVGGTMVLWPGDVTFDGVVKYVGANNDRDPILTAVGGSTPTNTVNNVYSSADVNMDGSIRYVGASNDRDIILQTIGGSVPTAIRTQQLP